MKEEITIVEGTREDIAGLFDLVCQLATYEKAREEVTVTVDDYLDDWESGHFEFYCAKNSASETIGIILYYCTYSTWKGKMLHLEDFIVTQRYRQQGVGSLLFDKFLEIAQTKGCNLVKWQVLDWNKPAIDFYRKNGAIIEKEWWNGKIIFSSTTR